MDTKFEDLPKFPYHPDPLATGSVRVSDRECVSCSRQRGYIYTGPVYSAQELDGELCPWCIADGSAAQRFDATFCDAFAPPDVAIEIVDIICKRTPGFSGWQQEHWLFHCGDGAAFLGPVGARELQGDDAAVESVRQELVGWPNKDINHYLNALNREGQPTAYLFECRICGTHLAYSDFT